MRLFAHVTLAAIVWLLLGLPIGLDSWLDVSETPGKADAIVCLAGGVTGYNLPLESGWDRVYTASQLFADGFAPYVVFTGRGSGTLSEAEIYRDAAVFLGLPAVATIAEAGAQSTAEHPTRLLSLRLPDGRQLSRESPLLIVTSDFHTRRVLMTFRKAGFSNVRVIARHRSAKPGERHARASAEPGYAPSGKSYDDPFLRLLDGSTRVLVRAREVAAIAWYRMHGAL